MGKGKRERLKRRTSDHEVQPVYSSRSSEERESIIRNVLLPLAWRKGIVTGIAAVKDGEVNQDDLQEIVESQPNAAAYEIQLKEES